jgi:hypothetical protein
MPSELLYHAVSNVTWVLCSMHLEALSAKGMPSEMKDIFDTAVRTVNFITLRTMN